MTWFRWEGNDLILRLRVTARASDDSFVGVANDCLKVRIAAPPAEGRANAQLIDFLARQFGTAKASIVLSRGRNARIKIVRIRTPTRSPAALQIEPPGESR